MSERRPLDPLGLWPKGPPRLPDPLGLFRASDAHLEATKIVSDGCANGLECLKNHFLRAHLYLSEAVRFSSSEGRITEAARLKIRQAREQLLAEDDFQQALTGPQPLRMEVLRLLGSARSVWKAIERSGIDISGGTLDDLVELEQAVKALYEKAYQISARMKEFKSGEEEATGGAGAGPEDKGGAS